MSTNEIMSLEGGEISVAVYVDMEPPVRNRDVQVNVTIDYNNAGTYKKLSTIIHM